MTRTALTDPTPVPRRHHDALPAVHEIERPRRPALRSQRALVEASLLRCPDEPRSTWTPAVIAT